MEITIQYSVMNYQTFPFSQRVVFQMAKLSSITAVCLGGERIPPESAAILTQRHIRHTAFCVSFVKDGDRAVNG